MSNLVQSLAFILPIVAALFVFILISLSLYLKIRRKLPINVNCWFCNEWTKVHYDKYNNFCCPKCFQYNGFDKHGGYNKILPEQHDELLNQQVPLTGRDKQFGASNGLCHICNNNQKLKIYQLANFVPLNEDAFDVEVEHFQKQLEKAYKLCGRCDKIVKNVIITQDRWLLGMKRNSSIVKGLSRSDLSKSSKSFSMNSKQLFFLNFLNAALVFLAFGIFTITFCNMDFFQQYLITYTYPLLDIWNNSVLYIINILHIYFNCNYIKFSNFNSSKLVMESILSSNISNFNIYTKTVDYINSKSLHITRPDLYLLCIIGLIFQIVVMIFNGKTFSRNIKQIVLWCCLFTVTWNKDIVELTTIGPWLQITISTYIVGSFFKTDRNFRINNNIRMKKGNKIQTTEKYYLPEDLSDQEDSSIYNCHTNNYASAFKFVPKSNIYCNETDTADSDFSFESNKSMYTSTENVYNETTLKMAPSLASHNTSHIFGKPANLWCPLPSPVPLSKLNNKNSVFNEPFMCSGSLNPYNISFKDLHSQNNIFASKTGVTTYKDTSLSSFDLNESLHNLHLGKKSVNVNVKVPLQILKNNFSRPILSPPKLMYINHNSWVNESAFWGTNYYKNNFSSSSSQSSGFASQGNDSPDLKFNCTFLSKRNSISDIEHKLVLPEHNFKNHKTINNIVKQNLWKHNTRNNVLLNNQKFLFKPIPNTASSKLEIQNSNS